VNAIQGHLKACKGVRDSAEELQIWLDYMEIGKMTHLRKLTKNFDKKEKAEDANQRSLILKELEVLLEHTESNRKTEAAKMEEKKQNNS